MNIFIPLQKADAAKREVWGVAAIEQPDQAREIMDYAKSKPHFLAWSERMKKASGGKSLGNVRDSHTTKAVGKVISLRANDAKKSIEVGVKIVDADAWQKVEEGVFTGFSIGGAYGERWSDPLNKALTRYEAKPNELSLVDVPCIPGATFEMVKADGSVINKQFPPKEKDEGGKMKDKEEPKEETPPAEGDNSEAPAEGEQPMKGEGEMNEETPMNSEDESAAVTAEESAEGEEMPEEPEAPALDVEAVKSVVIQLLLELGLVQETAGAAGTFKVAQSGELKKAAQEQAILSKALADFRTQIVGDIAKIVNAVEMLEKRGAGPVLREVAPLSAQAQADVQRASLLRKMAAETSDPTVKQSLELEASRLEIKKIQNS